MTSSLTSRWWRLNSLYWIKDADTGAIIRFRPNASQTKLLRNLHTKNIILKARQLGFTTLIQILIADTSLFSKDQASGVIAHKQKAAKDIMRNKVRFALMNVPGPLKPKFTLDNVTDLHLEGSGSQIVVDTSLRSGTFQILHLSEYADICLNRPDAAEEIQTGALNTLAPGCFAFIESTAKGMGGIFYDMNKRAEEIQQQGRPLSNMEYRRHFFPWYDEPRYSIDPTHIVVPRERGDYFEMLDGKYGIKLSDGQKAWYHVKAEEQGDRMGREFPTTPDEAFAQAIQGAIYAKEMALLRRQQRITKCPHDPMRLVHTAWDLGTDAIWFFQLDGREIRLIWYEEDSHPGLVYWANRFDRLGKERGWQFGTHLGPHDINSPDESTGERRIDFAEGVGLAFTCVPRTTDKMLAIEQTRRIFPRLVIDQENCAVGIERLDKYRREYNEKLGVFADRPKKDAASHGADGLETLARGLEYIDDYAASGAESVVNETLARRGGRHLRRTQNYTRAGF